MSTRILESYLRLSKDFTLLFFSLILIICVNPFAVNYIFKEAPVQGWPPERSRNASVYINPLAKPHIIPTDLCINKTRFLIIVFSRTSEFSARTAVRDSWGSKDALKLHNMRLYFLLGETTNQTVQKWINNESFLYKDVIQERFLDVYENLTLKSIAMLKMAHWCGGSFQYLVKVDADVFVNMAILSVFLRIEERKKTRRLLTGFLNYRERRVLDYRSKSYAASYMHRNLFYSPFLSGACYVASEDLVQDLYETTLRTPIFHLEDVYITGICAKELGITQKDSKLFSSNGVPFENLCTFVDLISTHDYSPKTLKDIPIAIPHLIKLCDLLDDLN